MEPVSRSLYVEHEQDPRDEILADLHDALPHIRVGGPDVMVCRYVMTGRVKSSAAAPGPGLLRPDQSRENDKWQSCVGLIVKLGPLAYQGVGDERTKRWYADETGEVALPKVGDWVYFDPKIGQSFLIGDRVCFLVPDQHIFLVLDRPDLVK